MKTILLLTFLISTSIICKLSAQEFINKLDNEFCDCVSKETNYTDKTFEDCSEKVIPNYQKDLEELYILDEQQDNFQKGIEHGQDFMKDLMIRLIRKCDAFYFHLEDLKKIGINTFKKEYESISLDSLSQKFKESQNINDYWEMANWNFANNKYVEAERMYKEILKNEPDQMESVYMLSLLYDEMGKYKEAKILYDQVYAKFPKIEYKLYSEMNSRKIK
ncbi:MAG: tetratricopeptide repeat protein [Kaistella sp.]|jgi:tetratricopeptide (TPR) repeat protein|nr:tetratricopeptide repeat protein [Kaistella sp.]